MPETARPSITRKQYLPVGLAALAALALMAQASPPGTQDAAKLTAYGRHLANECTSCHRIDGLDSGIPSIIGWPSEMFVATMKFYRDGTRTNPVMVSVAGSLNDRQVEALAAFFGALPKPPPKGKAPAEGKARK